MVWMEQINPNVQRSHARVQVTLQKMVNPGNAAILLVPSFAVAQRYRKEWAGEAFIFGLHITTLSAWVADRWDLYGDGRVIVSSMQRKLLIYQALQFLIDQSGLKTLALSPGTVNMLASMAREGLSAILSADIRGEAATLTSAESEAIEVLETYAGVLKQEGLCELDQAMDALVGLAWEVPTLIIEDLDSLNPGEVRFIKALAERTEVHAFADEMSLPAKVDSRAKELMDIQSCIFDPELDNPVKPGGSLRFLLPAGEYAKPLLLGENLVEYTKEGLQRIIVSANKPDVLFGDLAPYLSTFGIGVSVSSRKSFGETDFGKMFSTLVAFLFDESYTVAQLSDVILSPFSGISRSRAYELDAAWRGDRTIDKEACIKGVAQASSFLAQVFEAVIKKDFLYTVNLFEVMVKSKFTWSPAYRAEQLSAISALGIFAEDVTRFGMEVTEVFSLIEKTSIRFTASLPGPNSRAPQIDLMTLDSLAEEDACSADAVVLCDLDAAVYPVRDEYDAKTRFFKKLHIESGEDALSCARRRFFRVLSVPLQLLVCERALNTVDANLAYPAIMLEELLDCYRHDLLSPSEVDKATGLPRVLLPFVKHAGEERLFQNLTLESQPQSMGAQEILAPRGSISERSRSMIVLPHQGKGENDAVLSLSPSAVESYLECPYKWFSLRRLHLADLDAGFGPLEMGNFTHRVLKSFYTHFQEQIASRVTSKNMSQAKALLATTFDQHLDLQFKLRRSDGPLIPLSALEEAEVASLKKRVLRFLDREAQLLPGFVPRYFEHSFGDDSLVEYAGCTLHGSIDRIDVNDKGQAVVIDYKGSVSSDYAFRSASDLPWVPHLESEKPPTLPHKVQTLLYAQAVRRVLGLEVVGALYVSYGCDGHVSGAYDRRILGHTDLPGIDSEDCCIPEGEYADFGSALDSVELTIAQVLERLAEGRIAPHPRGKDPCGFCPVTACELRRRL